MMMRPPRPHVHMRAKQPLGSRRICLTWIRLTLGQVAMLVILLVHERGEGDG
jgi:hypothetical protein